nr:hypothetical protein [Tanacetum cinerariifolium]
TDANMNVPANDAPTEQAPAVTPPTRTEIKFCRQASRPRHPMVQILWGIIHRSNINYAERI